MRDVHVPRTRYVQAAVLSSGRDCAWFDLLGVSFVSLGVRVAAAQGEDPLVEEGMEEEEEEANVEVEDEVGVFVAWVWCLKVHCKCPKAVRTTMLICQSHEIEFCDYTEQQALSLGLLCTVCGGGGGSGSREQ